MVEHDTQLRRIARVLLLLGLTFALCTARQLTAQVKAPDTGSIDNRLLEGLEPQPQKSRPAPRELPKDSSAGEDLGAPSQDRSPLAEVGRRMRDVESRLRKHDTSAGTRQIQNEIVERLSTLLEAEERRAKHSALSKASQSNASSAAGNSKSTTEAPGGERPTTGDAKQTATDPGELDRWSQQIWGNLPDRIQQRMRTISNEEFLPQFEQRIQQYYERLSERSKKK